MKKRLSICLLTILLLVSSASPAYAAQGHPKTVVTAETLLPTIEISVPTLPDALINPSQLPVDMGVDVVNSQVVSVPSYIQNLSDVPILVSARTTCKIRSGSDMGLFPSTTVDQGLIIKRAFLYLEMQSANSPGSVAWASEYDEEQHVVIRTGSGTIKREMVILGASGQDKSYGAFRIAGDCVEEPKIPWTENDGVDVQIVFTFKALPVDTEIP